MLAALQDLRGEYVFDVAMIDVDADPVLEAKYDELVPILTDSEDLELCHYFLDVPKVREYLARFQ